MHTHHHKFAAATMARLERFAAAALTGMAFFGDERIENHAEMAFKYALAMLHEANKFALKADALNLEVASQ
jgi:hypothetical protein